MFDWSSPARRIGSRVLEPIPLEIYQEIFEYFRENDEMSKKKLRRNLANIALVCRFFSATALPRLFANVDFSGGFGPETSRANRFCRAIINNEDPAKTLAQYVKTCTFRSWSNHNPNDPLGRARDAFLTMYCNALPKMTSLESIIFNLTPIDKRIVKSIKSLRLLKSLCFSQCSLSPGLDLDQFTKALKTFHLRSLTIVQWEPSQSQKFYNTISPALSLHDLTKLEVDNWTIIQRLSSVDIILPLQTLTIHTVENPTLLPTLFSKTPQLLNLHVYIINSRVDNLDFIQLPGSLLPNLSFFDGPPSLAAILIPSRPVHKVWLMGTLVGLPGHETTQSPPLLPPLDERLWKALAKSKAQIRELLIPEHLYYAASPKLHLPTIATLKLSWCHANWDSSGDIKNGYEEDIKRTLSKLCTKWSPNPSVSQLVFELSLAGAFDYVLLNLRLQHEILQDMIEEAFPNVEQVNFLTSIDWRRSGDGNWRAEIPETKKRHLWALWNDDPSHLNDYGGCFEALFDSSNPDFRDYAEP
ncbi:hypothetical protein D9756_006978 [Leucocoprinus leucothites]|uniref:F-box domain-containing protein n=1 Tax=Leucocoprinus leucothites TaxID=201217 RepID=A0A8H5FZ33_9AGAR|nr:hypothetical protein D9756_006978 [Leucoagaricus leucothites]